MIPRDIDTALRELLDGFPVVTLTGPRQSGKTTLARAVFASKPYVSLEDPDVRRTALDDPRGFLARFPDGAVRDSNGNEVDIIADLGPRLMPIEIKSGQTLNRSPRLRRRKNRMWRLGDHAEFWINPGT